MIAYKRKKFVENSIFRIFNITPKYPVIGENVSMTCCIEVLPNIDKSGVEIEWIGPNQEFEADCMGGRIECDSKNIVKRVDDYRGKTKSYLISK